MIHKRKLQQGLDLAFLDAGLGKSPSLISLRFNFLRRAFLLGVGCSALLGFLPTRLDHNDFGIT